MILNQQVEAQNAPLATNIEQLNAKTTKLWQLYIEVKSHINSTCAPSYWPHNPGEDLTLPPSPPPLTPLF
jgi:hypothetical protein